MSELAPGTQLTEQYRIDAEIGRGRTSTVYRARDLELQRDVAVRLGHQAGAFAMAKLFHPNVVTVFEVGEHDGFPFVVMEYVRGETARDWLARSHTWREIVALFVAAGEGLAAAHAAGLLNHDFKPEHILIGPDGRPRIAAFGLGTREEQLAEQRAFCASLTDALDTIPKRVRRVLADAHPDMAALVTALRRAARPQRARWIASAATAALAVTGAIWFAHARHRQALRDDCARRANAVQWDVAARIRIAHALYGTGLTYADSTWRITAAAVDHFVDGWQTQASDTCIAFEVEHTESAALHERRGICLDRARIEYAAVMERLYEIDRAHIAQTGRLTGSLPDLAPCARADAIAAVDPARRDKLERYFTELAQVESLAHSGRYADAAKRSAELLRLAGEVDSPRDKAQASYLAGQIHAHLGHYADATHLFETALTTGESAADDALVAAIATELVNLLGNDQAHYDEAQLYVRYARAAVERVGLVAARIKIAKVLGRVELVAGHFDEAQRQLDAAVKLAEGAHDEIEIAAISTELSRLASARGRPAQAEPNDRRALAIYTAELGDEHPVTLTAASNLGTSLTELGRYDEARTLFEHVLEVTERVTPPDSEDLAYALNNVATTAAQAGDFHRARETLERSLAIFERTLDANHPIVAAVVKNLGDIASYEGRFDDATRFYTRALDARRTVPGDHPEDTTLLLALADMALARDDLAGARSYCEQARAAAAKSDANNITLAVTIDTCQGTVELATGHIASAIEVLELANKLIAKVPDMDPSAVGVTRFALAKALATSSPDRAQALARSARELLEHEGAFASRQLADVDAWLHAHPGRIAP